MAEFKLVPFSSSKSSVVAKENVPPPLQSVIPVHATIRYSISTGGSYTINASNLCLAIGQVCTAANSAAVGIATAVKLNRVTVWGSMSASLAQPSITWTPVFTTGGLYKDSLVDRSIQGGSTVGFPVTSSPPKGSYIAGKYMSAAAGNVFTVEGGTGSVVEIEATWQLKTSLSVPSSTVTATALGTFFYPALDGTATHVINPTSLPTSH